MGRYDRDYDFDFGRVTKREPQKPAKKDPLEDILRLASGAAPALGTAAGVGIGALAGGLPTGGIGAAPGAMIGGALGGAAGTALGGLGGYGADMLARDDEEAARRKAAEDEEQAAEHRYALQLLGGL